MVGGVSFIPRDIGTGTITNDDTAAPGPIVEPLYDYFTDAVASTPWYGNAASPSAIYSPATTKTVITAEEYDPTAASYRRAVAHVFNADATKLGSAKLWASGEIGDDHSVPVVVEAPNGRMYCFGGAHGNGGGAMKCSYSAPGDFLTWTPNADMPYNGSQPTAYPHPVVSASGSVIHMYWRKDIDSSTKMSFWYLPLTINADGSLTAGTEVCLFDFGNDTRVYSANCILLPNGRVRILFHMSNRANTFRQDVFLCDHDPATGGISNPVTGFSVAAAGLPYNLANSRANFRITAQFESGKQSNIGSQWFDNEGNWHCAYHENDEGGPYNVYERHMNGSTGALSAPVLAFTGEHDYDTFSGQAGPGAGQSDILFTSSDGFYPNGGNISRTRKSSLSGAWGAPTLFHASGKYAPFNRPIAVENGKQGPFKWAWGETWPAASTQTFGPKVLDVGNLRAFVGNDNGKISFPAPTYEPSVAAAFARLQTAPSKAKQLAINALIVSLKKYGIFDLLDGYWLLAGADAGDAQLALLDLIGTRDLTQQGTLAFTKLPDPLTGYAWLPASNGYLRTGFVPSTAGGKYTLNSSHMAAYVLTAQQGAGDDMAIQWASGSSQPSFFNARTTGDQAANRVNDVGATGAVAATDARGYFVSRRTASNSRSLIRNGVNLITSTATSSALPPREVVIFGNGNDPSSQRSLACASIGTAPSFRNATFMQDAALRYLQDAGCVLPAPIGLLP